MVVLQDKPDPTYERTFNYTFSTGQSQPKHTLRLQLNISEPQNIEELASRVVGHHEIPCFVEENLKEALKNFVESEKIKLSDETAVGLIRNFKQKPENVMKIAKNISAKYKKAWVGFTKVSGSEEDEDFSTMYHKLIHSRTMNILLSLEENYYTAVHKVVSDRENSMMKLQERQELEMQRACEHVNSSLYTEDYVNDLAKKHVTDTERLFGEWKNKYSKLVQNQRKEYRDVVSRLYAEMMANNGEVDELGHTYIEVKKILDLSSNNSDTYTMHTNEVMDLGQQQATSSGKHSKGSKNNQSNNDGGQQAVNKGDNLSVHDNFNTPRLEESFTINLGAQMKTMHNIRLVAAPILHYCRHSDQSGDVQAQRLQTILSLYSNSLSGLVLLADNSVDSVSVLKSKFTAVCEASTEFHFPSYKEQLDEIKYRKTTSVDQLSIKSEDTVSTDSSSSNRSMADGEFQDGDFYVTKHSNLSKVHIVFHLAANISNLCSSESSSTTSSRHPVIMGLRHILKVMSSHDVATLTLPILLCHELSDRNDEQWIVKRAELVMKCMKGFMMEMAAWDGGTSRTMQFVVPPDISDSTFYRLSAMLPEIFRTTSARNLTVQKKTPAPASPRPSKH